MKKKVVLALILLFFIIMATILAFYKPYLCQEKISTSEGELIIQTNLITNSMRFFDSTAMKWYEKEEYVELRIKKINDQFNKLYIKNYQTLINILEGKEKDSYSFIPADKITELITKNILIMTSGSGEEIIRKRAALINEFNELVKIEKEKRINDMREFINKGDFSNNGIKFI